MRSGYFWEGWRPPHTFCILKKREKTIEMQLYKVSFGWENIVQNRLDPALFLLRPSTMSCKHSFCLRSSDPTNFAFSIFYFFNIIRPVSKQKMENVSILCRPTGDVQRHLLTLFPKAACPAWRPHQ